MVAETIERMGETQQVRAGMQYLDGPLRGGKAQSQPGVHSGSAWRDLNLNPISGTAALEG